jgi:hypothetical protein
LFRVTGSDHSGLMNTLGAQPLHQAWAGLVETVPRPRACPPDCRALANQGGRRDRRDPAADHPLLLSARIPRLDSAPGMPEVAERVAKAVGCAWRRCYDNAMTKSF